MSSTIVRAARHDSSVIVDPGAIEDTRLSWAARGLLGYLLSRPDDWNGRVNDLLELGDLRRDGIYRLLRELCDTGYMRFVRQRDSRGRIRGGEYYVQEIAAQPHPDKPYVAEPNVAEPDRGQPDPDPPEALPATEGNVGNTTTASQDSGVEFANCVPEALHEGARAIVSGLDPVGAQTVIDEWAGLMAAECIEISPLEELRVMAECYQAGNLPIILAPDVADLRTKPLDETNSIVEIVVCSAPCDED